MEAGFRKCSDELPTEGDPARQAFRDVELEKELLIEAQNLGLGAQVGGKYSAHDIRVIRLHVTAPCCRLVWVFPALLTVISKRK
ncbi:fumarate hydratase [Shigella flexneri]